MLESLKKKSFKHSLIGTILFIVFGLSFMITTWSSVMSIISGYQSFEKLSPDKIKDQSVEVDVSLCFGYYMEEYSENTSTHRRTTTHLYYIILTGDENSVDSRYMTIKVPVRFQDQMDAITENTVVNGAYSEPLHLIGKIERLDSEEYGYLEDFFLSADWTLDEINEGTLPYYINVTGTTRASDSDNVYVVLFVIGIVLIIIGVYRIIMGATGGYLKKFRKAMEEAGCSEASMVADMNSAAAYEKKETIKVGRLFTYYNLNGTIPLAIPNKKMLWAYQNTTTHRTNGVKTGVTYSVMIYVDGEKNPHTVSVSTEAIAQDILKKIGTTLPWVIVGYSDELRKLFRKDRAQFLQLRYNTVEHVAVEPGFENSAVSADSGDTTTAGNTSNDTNQ